MKKIIQSNTFKLGVIVILGSVGEAIVSGGDWRTVAGAAIGAAIIVLRKITNEPVSWI